MIKQLLLFWMLIFVFAGCAQKESAIVDSEESNKTTSVNTEADEIGECEIGLNEYQEIEQKVKIEKLDYSVRNDGEQIIASIYYEKPVLCGNAENFQKINTYFDEESQAWYGNENRLNFFQSDRMDAFLENLEEMREAMGDDVLEKYPFTYTVDTEVMLFDDEILSILQIVRMQTAGPESKYYFGTTLNVTTGEHIPFGMVNKGDSDSVKKAIGSFLEEQDDIFYENGHLEDILKAYEAATNYEYFVDKKYIYIILNIDMFPNEGCVVKWNGKFDEEFEALLVGYKHDEADRLVELEY